MLIGEKFLFILETFIAWRLTSSGANYSFNFDSDDLFMAWSYVFKPSGISFTYY